MLSIRPQENLSTDISQAGSTCTNLSDLFISYLEQLGVEYVFGVPGGAIEPLYNALARSERRGSVRPIVARHETGAAFMAHGYYMSKRRLGVCCATTGPGATNMLTGVATAYENNGPMLVITAQTAMSHFGRGAFQESSDTSINTTGMFQYCTSYNSLVSHASQFEHKLYAAIMTAYQTSTPSHLSIPLDIFRSSSGIEKPSYDLSGLMHPTRRLDAEQLDKLRDLLLSSENPVFVIGEGCIDAIGTILSVATLLQAKVVTTPHAKGLVSPYHPLFRGVIGFAGHSTAQSLLADASVDLVIAIGTGLSEWASNNWDANTLMNEKLVHVEFLERRFAYSPMARMHVSGDIGLVFDKILSGIFSSQKAKLLREKNRKMPESRDKPRRHFHTNEEKKCTSDAVPVKPQRLMHELTSLFPPHTCYLADVGNSFSGSVHYLHPYDRRLSGERKRGYGVYHSCFEFAP
ncbi:MAG TPA: thiamine pyrophosphate-binding protein, partial [Gammaproteobacteria bacterium]